MLFGSSFLNTGMTSTTSTRRERFYGNTFINPVYDWYPRVRRLKARVGRLKARAEAINPRIR